MFTLPAKSALAAIKKKLFPKYGRLLYESFLKGAIFITTAIGLSIRDNTPVKQIANKDLDELKNKPVTIFLIGNDPIKGEIKMVKRDYVLIKDDECKIIYVSIDKIIYIES